MTCIELDERDGQMEHVCVSAPPHVAWSVASLEARCGSLALVFIFRRLQIRPTRGLRPAARDPTGTADREGSGGRGGYRIC